MPTSGQNLPVCDDDEIESDDSCSIEIKSICSYSRNDQQFNVQDRSENDDHSDRVSEAPMEQDDKIPKSLEQHA